eukprot:m.60817 g.60817  ORF g.60817 m.60817 type:complete len:62 (+) comp7978_c0_seq1:533-718(+)
MPGDHINDQEKATRHMNVVCTVNGAEALVKRTKSAIPGVNYESAHPLMYHVAMCARPDTKE